MNPPMCLEVLVATILAWAGLWGCVEELMRQIDCVYKRVALYVVLGVMPLVFVVLKDHVSVCVLMR